MPVMITEDPDLVPLCPHCDQELREIVGRTPKTRGAAAFMFGRRTVYACPSCRKVLGVSHRKGFWMG